MNRHRAAAAALVVVLAACSKGSTAPASRIRATVVAGGLDFPTNMAFAPDGRLFFDEKDTGRIRILDGGTVVTQPFATLPVQGGGESGLLGLALDPHFGEQPWVYVYYTSSVDGRNHLVRIRADGNVGGEPQDLLTLLVASGIHNGGDIVFGPDGKLYVAVGETGDSTLSQDPGSLGGKILRLDADGSIPSDNPFPGNPAYALGIRNSFGLCFNPVTGALWETENGPDRDDEVNVIEAGKNYGWPDHLGTGGAPQFVPPLLVFDPVIVVTGCAFFDRVLADGDQAPQRGTQLVFGDFHGDLHRALVDASGAISSEGVVRHFAAGITDLEVGPDGDLYVATSSSILRLG